MILNVGRGSAIDQDALIESIRSGRLSGAAIDVTTPEPLPPESPLWEEPCVLLTPHISGQFNLDATWENGGGHRHLQPAGSAPRPLHQPGGL